MWLLPYPRGMKIGSNGFKVFLLVAVFLMLTGFLCRGAVWVSVLSSAKEAGPGEFVTHVFSVLNDGAVPDVYRLEFEAPQGWGLLDAPSTISLEPGEEGILFVTVTVPPGATAGEYTIVLHAISQADPTDQASAGAAVIVSPVTAVEIIAPTGGSVAPGEEIFYQFTIVNRGNAQDTFQLEAESGHRFPLFLSQELVSLAPRERAVIEIRLQIPVDTSPGRDLLSVAATSIFYPGVSDEVILFTTILPPAPQAVGGTLMEELPARLRFSIDQDVFSEELDSDLTFSLAGGVKDGYFSVYLRASPLFGPDPFELDSFSVQYRRTPAIYVIGDTSKKLTDLLSLSCRGGRVDIDTETYDIVFIGGGSEDEIRVGGRLLLGPEEANVGIAYMELKDEAKRRAVWSLTAASKPLEGWSLRMEGALGIDDELTSRAFFFNTTIDTVTYFLSAEAFSVGTHFPGLRADQAGIFLSQRLRHEDLLLSASFGHEWDNVIRDPLAPTTITDELGLNLSATPLEEGPTIASTVEFTWERSDDPTLPSEIESLLSVALSETRGEFPYAFSAKLTDQIDYVAGTHFRTLTFSEGAGLSIEDFDLFLKLTQEKTKNHLTGELLSGGTDVSLRFSSRSALHSARITLANTQDDFDLSLHLDVRLWEDLHVLFDTTLGWDRSDATVATFEWGVSFDLRFDLPIPFLVTKGRIEGRAFVDQDGDGRFSTGDRGVGGIVVATQRSEVSSDESGYFRFPPFSPGSYELELRHLPLDVAPIASVRVDLEAGETAWVNLALAPVVLVSGVLFDDADRSGTLTEGEGGFAQVRVALMDPEGIFAEAYTDLYGRFDIRNVLPGRYTITVDPATLPERFVFTTQEEFTVKVVAETPPLVLFGGYIKPREVVITFQPPTAEFTYQPERPKAGEPVTFDASDSFDFDGEIVSYEWDFDADGLTDATGITVQYAFASPGAYEVTLTVTDNGGNSDSITYKVDVK